MSNGSLTIKVDSLGDGMEIMITSLTGKITDLIFVILKTTMVDYYLVLKI